MRKFKVPAQVKHNAKLFLSESIDRPESLTKDANLVIASRLASGEIDEKTFLAMESWAEGINWDAKLDGSTTDSNALLAIGGRSAKSFISETVQLMESDFAHTPGLQKDGSYVQRIRIASPGMGSSGYYPEQALIDSVDVFPAGTRILNAHVAQSKRVKESGLSLDDLVGETIEDAVYESRREEGPGLYTKVRIFPKVVERLGLEVVKKSQFSLYTQAKMKRVREVIDNRLVPVVERLIRTPMTSIDAVLVAGRGGKFVAETHNGNINMQYISESASPWLDGADGIEGGVQLVVISPVLDDEPLLQENGTDSAKGNPMTLEEAKALIAVLQAEKETITASKELVVQENAQLSARLRGFEVVQAIESVLAPVEFVNKDTEVLVVESIKHSVKFGEDGHVDKDALSTLVEAYTSGQSPLVKAKAPAVATTQMQENANSNYILPTMTVLAQEKFIAPDLSTPAASQGASTNNSAVADFLAATEGLKY